MIWITALESCLGIWKIAFLRGARDQCFFGKIFPKNNSNQFFVGKKIGAKRRFFLEILVFFWKFLSAQSAEVFFLESLVLFLKKSARSAENLGNFLVFFLEILFVGFFLETFWKP